MYQEDHSLPFLGGAHPRGHVGPVSRGPALGDSGHWFGVVWCGVAWRGVAWCGVVWRGVARRGGVGWGGAGRGVAWRGVGSGDSSVHRRTVEVNGRWGFFSALLHCSNQWAVGILEYVAAVQGAVGSRAPSVRCCKLRGAVGSGDPQVHCLTAGDMGWWGRGQGVSFNFPPHSGQWAVGILHYNAALQGVVGSGAPSLWCGVV